MPLSPWISGRPDDLAEERAGGALRDRHVAAAVGVEQAQRVLRAVADVRVAADGRDRQQVQLRAGDGEPDRERVVEPGVAVDDQRERLLRPSRTAPSAATAGAGNEVGRATTAGAPWQPALTPSALFVRLAGRGGPADASDDAGHDDDRHDVRDAR